MTIRNLDDLAIASGTKARNVKTAVLALVAAGGILLCAKLSNNTNQIHPEDAAITAKDAGAATDAAKELAGRVQVTLPQKTTATLCDLATKCGHTAAKTVK